ncbi:MAG: hypothetical protein NUK65_09710 [Firmicutes bacterium]|nr:hypothetical protein [Bacillota bacterium]
MAFKDVMRQGAIIESISKKIKNKGNTFKTVEIVMQLLGFKFSRRILQYGREKGYFPAGEQGKHRDIRYYSKGDIYIIAAALIIRWQAYKDSNKIITSYGLNIPNAAEKFLKCLDYYSKEKRAINLAQITDRVERLARSIILVNDNIITKAEWEQVVFEQIDANTIDCQVDFSTMVLEDQLGGLRKKLHSLINREIDSILEIIKK